METIKTIGWIGTGVMGASMCKHLLKAGYSLNVYNRSKSKSEELLKLGLFYIFIILHFFIVLHLLI